MKLISDEEWVALSAFEKKQYMEYLNTYMNRNYKITKWCFILALIVLIGNMILTFM